jgi:hypothetical protein
VPGRTAGVGQWSLVDLDDVAYAEASQVMDEAVADDPRPDHDDTGATGNSAQFDSPEPVGALLRITPSYFAM